MISPAIKRMIKSARALHSYAGLTGNELMLVVSADGSKKIGKATLSQVVEFLTVGTTDRKLSVRAVQSDGGISSFETWLGAPADMVMCFGDVVSSWSSLVSSVEAELAEQSGNSRPIELAVPLAITGVTLAQVASGVGDAYYVQIADALLAARPGTTSVYVRVGWEMNSVGGFPWGAFGHEADYIAAFRRIVGVFRARSSRFQFVWCPNWSAPDGSGGYVDPFSTMYPGDAYVNVVGVDFYFMTAFDQDSGQTAAQVWSYKLTAPYGLNALVTFATAHAKPIAIPEWGVDTDNAQDYMTLMAAWVRANDVVYHGYWDRDSGSNSNDRLSEDQYPATGARFKVEFGPLTITSSASRYGAKDVQTSLLLTASKAVTWSIPTPTTGFSIVGLTLLPATSLSLGAHAVTVRATDERGLYSEQVMSVDMQATLPDWTPAVLGSVVKAWFDATDAAAVAFSGASPWVSKVNGLSLSNATAGQRPTYQATGRNNKPSVRFALTKRLLLSAVTGLPQGTDAHTAVIQAYLDSGSGTFEEIGTWGNGTSNRRAFTTNGSLQVATQSATFHSPSLNSWSNLDRLVAWTMASGASPSSSIYVDGGAAATRTNATASTPNTDGSFPNPNGTVACDLQEWLIVNRVLTTGERQSAEGYLAWKWGLSSALPSDHPYKAAKPTITDA